MGSAMMLRDISLIKRRILELNFKDFLDDASEGILTQEGFLQIVLNKPNKDIIKFSDKVFILCFDAVIEALVKNPENIESDNVKDALPITKISISFEVAYTHSLELESVEKLISDESWFFQRDARVFVHEVASSVIANSAHDYIKLPIA